MQKKRNTLRAFIFLPLFLIGQTNHFEFTQQDTAYTGSEEFVIQYGMIVNLINEAQDITVTRVTHQIPATWTCSFCVGAACLPPFLDQHTFTLMVGDTSEFSLDTYPNGEAGFGSWTIFAENSTSGEIDSVHITLEYITVGVADKGQTPTAFKLLPAFPNPTNAWINFEIQVEQKGTYDVQLFALDGRLLTNRSYELRSGQNIMQWSLNDLASGNYLLIAKGMGQSMTQKVSVIK